MEQGKTCTKCGNFLHLNFFKNITRKCKNETTKKTFSSRCKNCCYEDLKEYRIKNAEKLKIRDQAYHQKMKVVRRQQEIERLTIPENREKTQRV